MKQEANFTGFEVFMGMTIRITVYWYVTHCSL